MLEGSGVKRGHAFGDIGDSLGGRAKLRLIIVTMRPMVMIAMVFVAINIYTMKLMGLTI